MPSDGHPGSRLLVMWLSAIEFPDWITSESPSVHLTLANYTETCECLFELGIKYPTAH